MLYTGIGCLASALTDNQIVAAVISCTAIMVLFFIGLLSFFIPAAGPLMQQVIYYFSPLEHMMDFSRGLFDTRPIVFYLSTSALMLFVTYHVFQYRRWKP